MGKSKTYAKRKADRLTMVGCYMDEVLTRRLDAVCFATGLNRSDVLRKLVETAKVSVSMGEESLTAQPIEAVFTNT